MNNKLKVGIFFGGQSREREISFLGGKTVYENLNRSIFEPVLIFIDSLGNFIQIKEELIYQESIRDFYPSKNVNKGFKVYIESLGPLTETQLYKLIYKIGKQVKPEKFSDIIDFAFLVMHGPNAEDGSIQGLLEWHKIPYMGPGMLGSSLGIDKHIQNKILKQATGQTKKSGIIYRKEWDMADKSNLFSNLIKEYGFPLVIKAPHQGSSIGVAIIKKRSLEEFKRGMQQCFFETSVKKKDWDKLSNRQKKNVVDKIASLNEGIGFPVICDNQVIYHPADLLLFLNKKLKTETIAILNSNNSESFVLIEEFTTGQEFSVGVIQDSDLKPFALPSTEVYGDLQTFDFKTKYKTNVSKKRIPVKTSLENLEAIERNILNAYTALGMQVISRIDGFLTANNEVVLHDPNTIPGMAPTSFIFKQMAEIGFNITDTLTYLIRQSYEARIREGKNTFFLMKSLKEIDLAIANELTKPKEKVGIIFGENDAEYKSAQKMYSKYTSENTQQPYLICAAKNGKNYLIPLNLIYKSSIEEFGANIAQQKHPYIEATRRKTEHIRKKYVSQFVEEVKHLSESDLSALISTVIYVKEA